MCLNGSFGVCRYTSFFDGPIYGSVEKLVVHWYWIHGIGSCGHWESQSWPPRNHPEMWCVCNICCSILWCFICFTMFCLASADFFLYNMWQQSTCLVRPGKPVLAQFAQREASSTGAGDGGGKNANLGTSEEIQRSWCFLLKGFFLFKAPFLGGKNP